LTGKCGELLELYDLLVKRLDERRQLALRTRQFFADAEQLPAQLAKIRRELEGANASIAGELGPLAQQKAITVIDEGQYLVERLGPEHPGFCFISLENTFCLTTLMNT
jgi:hypothetical protein